jgi:hypothetical protein
LCFKKIRPPDPAFYGRSWALRHGARPTYLNKWIAGLPAYILILTAQTIRTILIILTLIFRIAKPFPERTALKYYKYNFTPGQTEGIPAIVRAEISKEVQVIISGAGAAAIAIVGLLHSAGFKNITMCDARALSTVWDSDINERMRMAAAMAPAGLVTDGARNAGSITSKALDKRAGPAVAKAVAEAARNIGAARIKSTL